MKKLITLALGAIMALSMVACDNQPVSDEEQTPPAIGGKTGVQIPNPFIDCEDLASAEELATFEITLPNNYEPTTIRVMENEMIEVISIIDENEICFRKAVGSENISGDFNEYNEINELSVDDKTVTTKGNDGNINTTTWTHSDYSFSIGSSDGLSQDKIIEMVNELK